MRKRYGVALLSLVGLAACQTRMMVTGGQRIDVDAKNQLLVRVEGVETQAIGTTQAAGKGEPIHRVLQDGSGKVLFAYDLEVGKSPAADTYRFLLKPSRQQPTLAATRVVNVNAHEDAVRVELLERPGTGEKVADIYTLTPRPAAEMTMSPLNHLKALHDSFFHWVHGS